MRLSRLLTNLAEFVTTESMARGMKFGEIRDLLQARFSEKLRVTKRRVYDNGPPTPERIASIETEISDADDAIKYDSPLVPGYDEREALALYAEGLDLQFPEDPNEFAIFKGEFKRAYRGYLRALVAHLRTLDGYEFGTQPSASNFPSSAAPTDQPLEAGITLEDLIKRFTADRQKAKAWGLRTADEKEKHFNLLCELLGSEKDVKSIAIADAQRIKNVITQYPKNRFKNPSLKGRSLDEIMKDPSIETIDILTANKYIQTFSSLLQWGKDNFYVSQNLFERMVIQKASSGETREAFSKSQIRRMLAELTNDDSLWIREEYQRWGPLIGIYTGARLNEIAQLRLDDVKTDTETGVRYLDLNDDGDGMQLDLRP
ncbi:Uncharacterised protein [Starkeya nomas]|uniref:Tyr recombinase domain-containing protein n=1 Tax=Starkeya nomas TaxID=2666134 RepID=A0A5S9NIL9_9HYPH|nr:Uncharacterised protein [Starkeya nomas]